MTVQETHELEFVVPGTPVSGNHRTAVSPAGQIYVLERAREYTRRIQSIAKAAAVAAGWIMPHYVRVDIELHNIRMDRDNAHKSIADALQGIVYVNDSRILDGTITRVKDEGAAGVRVSVVPVNGGDYGFKPPRRLQQPVPRMGKRFPAHVQAAIAAAHDA